jgi:hypothetical protein
MAEPTKKATHIKEVLDTWTKRHLGISRTEAITKDICVWCKRPATEFKDEISRREYRISGMCQSCQDETFGSGE